MLLQVRLHNRLRNWSDLLQIFKITLRGHPSYSFRCKTLSTFVTMHATPWYNVSAISCSHFVYLTAILTDFICSVLLLQKCLIYLAQSRPHVGYVKRNCTWQFACRSPMLNKTSEIVARTVRDFMDFNGLWFRFIVDFKCLKVQRSHRLSTSNLLGEVRAHFATARPTSIWRTSVLPSSQS